MNGSAEWARLAAVAPLIGRLTCLALMGDAALVALGAFKHSVVKQTRLYCLFFLYEMNSWGKSGLDVKACCVAVSSPQRSPQLRWARPRQWARSSLFSATIYSSSSSFFFKAGLYTANNTTLTGWKQQPAIWMVFRLRQFASCWLQMLHLLDQMQKKKRKCE